MKFCSKLDVRKDKYYLIYNIFNPYIGITYNVEPHSYNEIYGICNFKSGDDMHISIEFNFNRLLTLSSKDIIFELTDLEVLKHIVMETI